MKEKIFYSKFQQKYKMFRNKLNKRDRQSKLCFNFKYKTFE